MDLFLDMIVPDGGEMFCKAGFAGLAEFARLDSADGARILAGFLMSEVEIVPVTGKRAVHAAELKVDRKIGYADAFAVELAAGSPECVLVTADYGFKAVEELIRIELLVGK